MTKRKLQRFAENLTFPHFFQPGVSFPPIDFELKGKWGEKFFRNGHPLILELGCGRGEYTVNLAEQFPDKNFVGIDCKGGRLWRGAKTVQENKMENVAFLRIQIQHISSFFSAGEVDEIWITFPDPQLQKSRERKRLTSPRYLNYYRSFLKPGGSIHLKTDSHFLYEYTREVLQSQGCIIRRQTDDLYGSILVDSVLSIKTTYEKIWLEEGAKICYLEFQLS